MWTCTREVTLIYRMEFFKDITAMTDKRNSMHVLYIEFKKTADKFLYQR